MRSRIAGPALLAIALIALVGCSGTSGGSAAPSASGAAPTSAEASAGNAPATPSAAPSSAPPSEAAASEPAASQLIPGFTFPSDAKDLEAVIPDTICGAKAQKLSLKGKDVFNANNPDAAAIEAVLNSIGKSTATSAPPPGSRLPANSDCSVIIIRINGADEGQAADLMLGRGREGEADLHGDHGGRQDRLPGRPGKFDYTYIKGDGVIIFTAGTKKEAEDLIAQLVDRRSPDAAAVAGRADTIGR